MRGRRVIVRAVVDSVVAAAAPAAVPSRRCLHTTAAALAPKRRTASAKTKAAAKKAPRRTEATASSTPAAQAPAPQDASPAAMLEERTDAPDPGAFTPHDEAPTVQEAAAAVAAVEAEEEDSAAVLPSSSPSVRHADGAAPPVSPAATALEPDAAAAEGSVAAHQRMEAQRQERRQLAALQRRLLVGAYAALESTADRPDSRTRVPRYLAQSAPPTAGSRTGDEAAADPYAGSRLVFAVDPPPGDRRLHPPAASTAAAPLPLEKALRVLANAFAVTLHSVPARWRTVAATATAPLVQQGATVQEEGDGSRKGSREPPSLSASSSSSSTAAAAASLSFLASPFSVAVVQALSTVSPFSKAAAMESVAPIQWLETSFAQLCRRVARAIHDELQHSSASSTASLPATAAHVVDVVRGQAAAIVAALEEEGRSAGSRGVAAMRRQLQRQNAAAAAVATAARRRKSTAGGSSQATAVTDTLMNTVERVGLELHLLHTVLTQLAAHTPAGHLGSGATCVESVVQHALGWGGAAAAEERLLQEPEIQWMLATALLERLHTQTYHFHYSMLVNTPKDRKDAAGAEKTRPTYVVEEKRLVGLAALVEFTLSERGAARAAEATASSTVGRPAHPTTALDDALFTLLAAYYAVLPVYAVLLPAWQRIAMRPRHSTDSAGVAGHDTHSSSQGRGTHASALLTATAPPAAPLVADAAAQRDAILAASATSVWDAVAEYWALQEERVRHDGALEAVWWLRMVPLWLSTATGTLQLRLMTAAAIGVSSREEEEEGDDAETTTVHVGSDTVRGQMNAAAAPSIAALLRRDVVSSLDGLLAKSSDLLRDVLRFDRVRYERSLSNTAATTPAASQLRGDPRAHLAEGLEGTEKGETKAGEDGAVSAAASPHSTKGSTSTSDGADGEGAEGGAADGDALPPLLRHRGKRSLFYKPADGSGNTILQGDPHDHQRTGSSSARSRFVSRAGSNGGAAVSGSSTAAGAGGSGGSHPASTASSLAAHEHTSGLFDVVVLSSETPIVLPHRFSVSLRSQRSTVVEESWAATAHAKGELWQLLYVLPPAATVAAASVRTRAGQLPATQVLRSVMPAAVLSLLPTHYGEGGAAPTSPPGHRAARSKKGTGRRATPAATADSAAAEERTLRSVAAVLQSAQSLFSLRLFESLDHILAALARVLLLTQRFSLVTEGRGSLHGRFGDGSGGSGGAGGTDGTFAGSAAHRTVDHATVHANRMLTATITIGATRMLADNPLSLAALNAEWQLWRMPRDPTDTRSEGREVSSTTLHAFGVRWTADLVRELPFLMVRCRQQPDAVLSNARELLKALQTPAIAATMPLFARQVTVAAILRSVHALANAYRHTHESPEYRKPLSPSSALAAAASSAPFRITHSEILELYRETLKVLEADVDLRLLCAYAAFMVSLYEVHEFLRVDRCVLNEWTQAHLLPLVLPVVVAGLHRSQATHNAATHADLCETTLIMLSSLSRCAANPQSGVSSLQSSTWNQVLLHVSLYCIRIAGRGGAKRVGDYGLPLVTLPDPDKVARAEASLLTEARYFNATYARGAEAGFLSMLDRSNNLFHASYAIRSRDVDAAAGVRAALSAFVSAWEGQVRFGRRDWEAMVPPDTVSAAAHAADDSGSTATQLLLSRLEAVCAAVQSYRGATLPAFAASAEATPFLASLPGKAHQLGFLVRFTEQYLREQAKARRLLSNELPFAKPPEGSRVAASLASSPAAVAAGEAMPLSDAAPLVLLDFVAHLTSAGGWSMVMWACNLSETVVSIEMKRHRTLPEAARVAATTAILSQLRAVSAPKYNPLLDFKVKAMVNVSDMVSTNQKCLLGFVRNSPLRGLLAFPTRDQFRVLVYGVTQAMTYVQTGSRDYRAWQDTAEEIEDGDGDEEEGRRTHDDDDDTQSSSLMSRKRLSSESRALQRTAGVYYALAWHAHTHPRSSDERELQRRHTLREPRSSQDSFRHYLMCMVVLFDTCMELAQLYLQRQQGDGEEDIRRVLEAAVVELCRSLSANIQSFLTLTAAQRRDCFYREEAQLLWTSLCVAATVSSVAPRDTKDLFFTPRCTQAIRRVMEAMQRLVTAVARQHGGSGRREKADDESTTNYEEEGEAEELRRSETGMTVRAPPVDDGSSSRSGSGAPCDTRPLATALVRGVRDFLRDTPSTHRTAARLAINERTRDDLAVVLMSFHALELSARAYEPGCALLTRVWDLLAGELALPVPALSSQHTTQQSTPAADFRLLAATVPSRSEYSTVLRNLAATRTEIAKSAPLPSAAVTNAGAGGKGSRGSAQASAATLDLTAAVANVTEDAAAIQQERQHYILHESVYKTDKDGGADTAALEDSPFYPDPASPLAASPVRVPVAVALESKTVPLGDILDGVIRHSSATLVAASRRSSFDATISASLTSAIDGAGFEGSEDDSGSSSDFSRLVREFYQDMMDLLRQVPLRSIVNHPFAERLFEALSLVEECETAERRRELWTLLADKWTAAYIAPCEQKFMQHQAAQLALVRAARGMQHTEPAAAADGAEAATEMYGESDAAYVPAHKNDSGGRAGSGPQPPPPDMLAHTTGRRDGHTASTPDEISISSAAQRATRQHWHTEAQSLPHHDDGRRLVGRQRQAAQSVGGAAAAAERFAGELDAEATGAAALAAMPEPVPPPVLLSLLGSLSRRRGGHGQRRGGSHPGGWSGYTTADGEDTAAAVAAAAAAFAELVGTVLTYTSRAYWLLRPRLDDGAWLAWAVVERGMSVYPAEQGVRQLAWDHLCVRWRLPASVECGKAVAGQLFSAAERRRISGWLAVVQAVCPAMERPAGERSEEVAVYHYMRALALYVQLLTMSMDLASRNGIAGTLPESLPDNVRRTVLSQFQRRGTQGEDGYNGLVREAMRHERCRVEEDRQTQQLLVNGNIYEGALLHYLNVSWCLLRHADSLTHMATDVVIARMTSVGAGAGEGGKGAQATSAAAREPASSSSLGDINALVAFAENLRRMAVGTVQDTLRSLLLDSNPVVGPFTARVSQTLLTSGFSCEPLSLRVASQLWRRTKAKDSSSSSTAPAVTVVATVLNAATTTSTNSASAAASASLANTSSVMNPVARAELFVGSPTMLGVLTPHFIKQLVSTNGSLETASVAILPIIAALDFYLSRRNVPLSPLMEATTQLLTSTSVRNSAVHTFCERLASELTLQKEFRQALAPPTIASVEQGAAGSISNEVVISFVAAIARDDVRVTKKTLALLLHTVMSMRPDVFGQPPTTNRQGKLTLVQVGTTVESTIDTTNPLYTLRQPRPATGPAAKKSAAAGGETTAAAERDEEGEEDGEDAAVVLSSFNVDKWSDFTAMTHRKALAALTLPLPTVMEVAMHMDAMRTLDYAERQRAVQMLKAADDARRERVAMHRSQAQVAAAAKQGSQARTPSPSSPSLSVDDLGSRLDASLHLEDPLDYGVAMLHLRYALRKVVHACLRRLLHQQRPHALFDVAAMLEMVDPSMRPAFVPHHLRSRSTGAGGGAAAAAAAAGQGGGPQSHDGVFAGTMRVLLSRAVLCAQAIGYDSNGNPLELPVEAAASPLHTPATPPGRGGAVSIPEHAETTPVLKLPVPALQTSAVEAAISAQSGSKGGRHPPVGHSSGKIGQLTREDKAAVHQRVELEREAAMSVGQTSIGVTVGDRNRIYRAMRFTRLHQRQQKRRREAAQRRRGHRSSSSPSFASPSGAANKSYRASPLGVSM